MKLAFGINNYMFETFCRVPGTRLEVEVIKDKTRLPSKPYGQGFLDGVIVEVIEDVLPNGMFRAYRQPLMHVINMITDELEREHKT